MELEGTVKLVGETKTFGNNGFQKREMVITTSDQYPQHILIEFTQDKCDLLNSTQVGHEVKVGINILGREWTSPQGEVKYFNSIKGWRIENQKPLSQQHIEKQPSTAVPTATPAQAFEPADTLNEEDHDDLPF